MVRWWEAQGGDRRNLKHRAFRFLHTVFCRHKYLVQLFTTSFLLECTCGCRAARPGGEEGPVTPKQRDIGWFYGLLLPADGIMAAVQAVTGFNNLFRIAACFA